GSHSPPFRRCGRPGGALLRRTGGCLRRRREALAGGYGAGHAAADAAGMAGRQPAHPGRAAGPRGDRAGGARPAPLTTGKSPGASGDLPHTRPLRLRGGFFIDSPKPILFTTQQSTHSRSGQEMLEKTYDAASVEPKIANAWDEAEAFRAGANARP